MIARLNKLIFCKALRLALLRPAPTRIPRSLPRAAAVDCFVATLSGPDGSWSVLVESQTTQSVGGLWLSDGTYQFQVELLPATIRAAEFECTHFLGSYEFRYKSPLTFVIHQWLKFPYISVLRDKLEQYQFNRQHLVRRDRIEILRYVYEASLDTPAREVSSTDLAATLYTNRLFFHPDRTRMLNHCRMLLDSLVATTDLRFTGAGYTISTSALNTLSQHEEDERRHRDMFSQQRALNWLTVMLIVVGLVQAYSGWSK